MPLLRTETVELACQVNGKIRDRINVAQEASDDAIRAAALRLEEVQQAIADRSVKRVVVVPGRLVNIVVG
jgi:leucyl-tRNA synthetase